MNRFPTPPEVLDTKVPDKHCRVEFQLYTSLLRFGSGWFASHELQRSRPPRSGCNPPSPRAGPPSSPRYANSTNPLRSVTCCLIPLTFMISCGMGDWSYDEVARVPSPSGQVDAVLVEGNGGATTSFGYYLYVVPKGKKVSRKPDAAVASLYGARRSESAYGVDLKWDSTNKLTGEYLSAQSAEIVRDAVTVAGQQITITLRSNINNSAAPAGGMLYNLRNKP